MTTTTSAGAQDPQAHPGAAVPVTVEAGAADVVVPTPHVAFDPELVRARASLVLDTRAAVPLGDKVFRL